MPTPTDPFPTPPPPPLADDNDWDKVDQAAWESFPASDPPGYHSTRAAPSPTTMIDANKRVAVQVADCVRRRRIERVLKLAAGGLAAVLVWKLARATR